MTSILYARSIWVSAELYWTRLMQNGFGPMPQQRNGPATPTLSK